MDKHQRLKTDVQSPDMMSPSNKSQFMQNLKTNCFDPNNRTKSLATTKATFNINKQLFSDLTAQDAPGEEEAKMNKTAHNWLDKSVVNNMMKNFSKKEQMKRNQFVKTA